MKAPLQVDPGALQLLSGTSLKDSDERQSSRWAELQAIHLVVNIIKKKKMGSCVITYLFIDCGKLFGWMVRNSEEI